MKNVRKITIAMITILVIVAGLLTFYYFGNDQVSDNQIVNGNTVTDDGEYINDKIGFSVEIPEGYAFYNERHDVTLYTSVGPTGDTVGFSNATETGKNIIINHVSASNDNVFELFEEFHNSDQYLVDEVVDLAWNAKLIRHRDGALFIMKAQNTNDYFEFIVEHEGDSTEDILMQMYESFQMI